MSCIYSNVIFFTYFTVRLIQMCCFTLSLFCFSKERKRSLRTTGWVNLDHSHSNSQWVLRSSGKKQFHFPFCPIFALLVHSQGLPQFSSLPTPSAGLRRLGEDRYVCPQKHMESPAASPPMTAWTTWLVRVLGQKGNRLMKTGWSVHSSGRWVFGLRILPKTSNDVV